MGKQKKTRKPKRMLSALGVRPLSTKEATELLEMMGNYGKDGDSGKERGHIDK